MQNDRSYCKLIHSASITTSPRSRSSDPKNYPRSGRATGSLTRLLLRLLLRMHLSVSIKAWNKGNGVWWLEEVIENKGKAQSLSSAGGFNMKMRYRAGKNAFKITEDIESLIKENLEMNWSDTRKPLGKVNSKITSSSAPTVGDAQNHFKSREESFKKTFESLQQDHTSKVVIGQQINMFSIQQAVAEYMDQSLIETSITVRADRLRITFGNLPDGRKKVLVILDDVWETIELKDIRSSPLLNGFKLLLTSRNEKSLFPRLFFI
ncbi:hypothetical protein L2E82_50884 [Cichorium intybus]|nr:hypothetical protein L2E82_50884 [Cichorium intybus]